MRTVILTLLISLITFLPSAMAAPVVTSQPATEIGDVSAKISGTINVNSIGIWLLEFKFGKTAALELPPVAPSDNYYVEGGAVGNVTQSVDSPKLSLQPGTTYFFRLSARNANDHSEVQHGEILSFTTVIEELGGTTPTVVSNGTGVPSQVSHKNVRVTAQVYSGSSPTKIFLRYGTALPLKNQRSIEGLQETNTTEAQAIVIEGLNPATTYFYHWMVTNSKGSYYSETKSFTTTAAPTLVTGSATGVGADYATLNGTVDVNGGRYARVTFQYGETTDYGKIAQANLNPIGADGYTAPISSLRPGTTYHFRIKSDQNDSPAFEYGSDMTFTTKEAGEAPTFTVPPTVELLNTSSATAVIPGMYTGTSNVQLSVDFGIHPGFGSTVTYPVSLPSFKTYTNFKIPLTNLEPDTLYHFRFRGTNGSGTSFSETSTFHTFRIPVVTTGPATDVTDIWAKPTATFDLAGGTIRPGIEWGETTEYGKDEKFYSDISGAGLKTQIFDIPITPSKTYHYRAYAYDGSRYYYGEDKTFTTSVPITLPDISDPRVTVDHVGAFRVARPHISADTASLEAFFFSGGSPATLEFDFGTTPAFGQVEVAALPDQMFAYKLQQANLINLTPDTIYYWRARASNASGTVYSDTFQFTTLVAPGVVTSPAISVTDSSATLTGTATPNLWDYNLEFTYGLDATMTSIAEQISPQEIKGLTNGVPDFTTRNVSATARGLLPNTTYYYQLRAKPYQTIPFRYYTGEIRSFTTGPPATPPNIGGALVASDRRENSVKLLLESFHAGSSESSVTFEYGTTTAYGQEILFPDTFATAAVGSPMIVISGLSAGTTYHARVKITNGQGTVYSPDLIFSTLPPGTAPVFSGETGTQFVSISDARLLAGLLTPGDAATTLVFEYGTTNQYGQSTSQTIAAGNVAYSRWANINGLEPATQYHFRATASSIYGSTATVDSVFITAAEPIVITGPVTSVSDISATISGEVTPNGITTNPRFQWGETTAYGNNVSPPNSIVSGTEPVPFSTPLTGLKPNTTYHYKISFGNFDGEDLTFTTGAPASLPTASANLSIFGISANGADLRIQEVTAGGSETQISFEYGITTGYGQEIIVSQTVAAGGKLLNSGVTLVDLTPDTIYHVRSRITNAQGTVYGDDHTFSTSFHVTTDLISDLSPFNAVLHGSANPGGGTLRLYFRWSDSTSLNNRIEVPFASGMFPVTVSLHLAGLLPGKTYYYRMEGADSGGRLTIGQTLSFDTLASPLKPTVPDSTLEISSILNNGASLRFVGVHAGMAVTTVTFEYGTTTNYGSSAFGGAPFNPGNSALSTGQLTGLLPDTLYHVRVKAENEHGTGFSQDFTFRTLPEPVFTALSATAITDLTATVKARVAFNGNSGISPRIAYGKTGSNPSPYRIVDRSSSTVDPITGAVNYESNLANLDPNTDYNFRIESVSYYGKSYYSEEVTVRTLPGATRPSFLTDSFTANVSHDKALVSFGNVLAGSSNASITIQYGKTTAYGSQVSLSGAPIHQQNGTEATLAGLTPGTTYHVRAKATNAQGTNYSQDRIFTTFQPPILILNPAQNVSDISAMLNGSVNPRGRSMPVYFRIVPLSTAHRQVNNGPSIVEGGTAQPLSFGAVQLLDANATYTCKLTTDDRLNYYESNEITFTTGAPASPPILVGSPVLSNIGGKSATVRITDPDGAWIYPGSSTASLAIEYGLTEIFGNTTANPPTFRTGSKRSTPNFYLNNLTPGSTYYLRTKASNAEGTAYGETVTFQTLPTLFPETLAAEITGTSTVKLHGQIATPGATVFYRFQYGTTTNYGSTSYSVSIADELGNRKHVSAVLNNLLPETTYHYRLSVEYQNIGEYFYGNDMIFTTPARPPAPPSILGSPFCNVQGTSSISIAADCDSGTAGTNFVLHYGTTSSLENSVAFAPTLPPNTRTRLQKVLTGLNPGTRYFFRLTGSNSIGSTESPVSSYTTQEVPVPYGITAYDISLYNAKLIGSIQYQAGTPSVQFQWGETTSYGNTINAYQSANTYSATLSGLFPSRTYHYRMVATSGTQITYSEDKTFITAAVPIPPFVGEILTSYGITADAATVWIDRVGAPADIVFEYGTTSALGQTVAFPPTVVNDIYLRNVAVDLFELIPDTIYHFRCFATNTLGTTASAIFTFRTLPIPEMATNQATDVSGDSATFQAEINPNRNLLSSAFEYGLTPAFGQYAAPLQPVLHGTYSSGISAAVTQLSPGTTYHYRVTAIDARGHRYIGPPKTVKTLSMLEDWRKQNFGFEANSGIAADLATPYGDGTPNLIKYALGIPPQQLAPDLFRKNTVLGKNRMGLSFTRDPHKTSLTYTVEANDILTGTWETIAISSNGATTTGTGIISESPAQGGAVNVDVTDTVDMSSRKKRFIRLKVTSNE